MFPDPDWTPWLLLAIPLLWLCRWLIQGQLTWPTPLDGPLLGLLLMVLVSLWATFDLLIGFHELCGILLGLALFYGLVNGLTTERAIWLAAGLLIAAGAMVAAVSLVGTGWSGGKVPLLITSLRLIYRQLPPLIRDLPRAEGGFNANQVGGTLLLFIPLVASLLWHRFSTRRAELRGRAVVAVLGLGVTLALMIFVLLLTQSRLSYVAAVAGLLLVIASQGKRAGLVVIVILVLSLALVIYYGPAMVGRALFGVQELELASVSSWNGRVEIWRRALHVIQDHPFTGIGLGALTRVVHARYPLFLISPGQDFVHAHNLFLQVGVALGVPGLMCFVWLLVAFGRMMWQVTREASSARDRALATGLSFGVLSHLFFGLADAVHLGAKPGIFLWAFLGLGAALWINVEQKGKINGTDAGHLDHRAV
jgi:hypothetical protein